jgi:hypothetical protein
MSYREEDGQAGVGEKEEETGEEERRRKRKQEGRTYLVALVLSVNLLILLPRNNTPVRRPPRVNTRLLLLLQPLPLVQMRPQCRLDTVRSDKHVALCCTGGLLVRCRLKLDGNALGVGGVGDGAAVEVLVRVGELLDQLIQEISPEEVYAGVSTDLGAAIP